MRRADSDSRSPDGKSAQTVLAECSSAPGPAAKDLSLLDEQTLKAAGAKGVIKPGKNCVQVIIGLKVQAVADALHERLK